MEGWGHAAWAGEGAGRSLALQEPAVWATPFPPGPQSPRGSFQLDPPSSPQGLPGHLHEVAGVAGPIGTGE